MEKRMNEACPCPDDCVRHGDCQACEAYHATRPRPPKCQRPELAARDDGDEA